MKTRTNVQTIRKTIREIAGTTGHPTPIVVVAGDTPPAVVGRSYYHTTPGGTVVRYPLAFARRHWPTVYNCSTRRVEVGSNWIRTQFKKGV